MNNRAIAVLALVFALVIFFAYVNPTWSGEIANLTTAIANDDAALAAAASYTAQQNQLASARNAIDQADLARLTNFLPDSVDNVGLILDLDTLAARSGLSLANIDVASAGTTSGGSSGSSAAAAAAAAKQGPVGSVYLMITAVGTYASLQNFLAAVERSGRLLDVRDLTVKGSDTGAYNYQMTLRLYWLR